MRRARSAFVALTLAAATAGLGAPAYAQRAAPRTAPASPPSERTDRNASRDAANDIDLAEQAYAKLDYDQANVLAERIIKKNGLSHDHLVRAYRLLAVTLAILDKEAAAREAFFQLLLFDPTYTVDKNLGPKVNTPFAEALGSFRSLPDKPGVEVSASVSTGGGTLRVTTRDPGKMVKRLSVGYRWTSSGDYSVTSIPAGDLGGVDVAPAPPGRTRLDFYVQALDDHDNAVLEAGNPNVPKSAFADSGPPPPRPVAKGGPAEEGESRSVFGRPAFWIITAAVLGAGAAAYFVFRPEEPANRASLSPIIVCGTDRCN